MKPLPHNILFTIRIYIHNGIIDTISIRTYAIIFFRHRINRHKPSQRSIIMPCTVIVPVQAVLRVKLLAVIFIRLDVIRCREYPTERIIMTRFLDRSRGTDNHTVIALMVFQIIMVLSIRQSDVTLFRQQVFLAAVFIDHIPAIVRCGGRTACLMHRAKLCTISRIQIGIVFPFPNVTLLGKFKQLY